MSCIELVAFARTPRPGPSRQKPRAFANACQLRLASCEERSPAVCHAMHTLQKLFADPKGVRCQLTMLEPRLSAVPSVVPHNRDALFGLQSTVPLSLTEPTPSTSSAEPLLCALGAFEPEPFSFHTHSSDAPAASKAFSILTRAPSSLTPVCTTPTLFFPISRPNPRSL